jgi:hypothetical protein
MRPRLKQKKELLYFTAVPEIIVSKDSLGQKNKNFKEKVKVYTPTPSKGLAGKSYQAKLNLQKLFGE